MKRQKIFLGAYLNVINAQNLNCRSLSKYLDKKKYKIISLSLGNNLDLDKIEDVFIIKVSPLFYKTSNFFSFLLGVLISDICYFPKHQSTPKLAVLLARLLKRKIFTTIEGNMCDESKENMISNFGSLSRIKSYFRLFPNIYGITTHIINNSTCAVNTKDHPLFLGVDRGNFKFIRFRDKLNEIIFIGSLNKRKNVNDFINLAKLFPDLKFHVVGSGPEEFNLKEISTSNVFFHGSLNHLQLSDLLNKIDLHFLPSKSEGFPKVILETASLGIPSILYNTYGADEWIDSGVNGFLLSEFTEVVDLIDKLKKNSNLLYQNSTQTVKISEIFDWNLMIKYWENEIDSLL